MTVAIHRPPAVSNCRMARPFPLRPLLDALGLPAVEPGQSEPGPLAVLASRLTVVWGMTEIAAKQRLWRWVRRGLTVEEADALACAIGVHPCVVWPDWWEIAAEEDAE